MGMVSGEFDFLAILRFLGFRVFCREPPEPVFLRTGLNRNRCEPEPPFREPWPSCKILPTTLPGLLLWYWLLLCYAVVVVPVCLRLSCAAAWGAGRRLGRDCRISRSAAAAAALPPEPLPN